MKKPLLSLILLLFGTIGYGQRVYFIYLQTDNAQPFYTRLDEKVYSSNASGYLIIPSLRDTAHQLAIGFINGEIPEHRYNIKLNRKDRGYLIKNFGDRGWGLFDMQELSIISPVSEKSTSMKTERLPSNQFMDMLVRAADDTTLRERPILVKDEKKEEAEQPKEVITKVDPALELRKDDVAKLEVKTEEVDKTKQNSTVKPENKEPEQKNEVKTVDPPKDNKPSDPKITETRTEISISESKPVVTKPIDDKPAEQKKPDEKKELKPIDLMNETKSAVDEKKIDTPVVSEQTEANNGGTTTKEPEYVRSTILRRSESSTTEGFGLTFVDLLPGGGTDTIRIMIPNPSKNFGVKQEPEKPREDIRFLEIGTDSSQQAKVVRASNCKDEAGDADFFKLRKKMASASSDASMLNEARKAFRSKCYSTEQIKNISTLFLHDEGKYKFFDAAYGAVSDPENFGALSDELKEEFYVNRFKAMLK